MDVVKILQTGFGGICILLAGFSFRLLIAVIKGQKPIDSEKLAYKHIRDYMLLSFGFGLMALSPEIIKEIGTEQKLDGMTQRLTKTCESIKHTNDLNHIERTRSALKQECGTLGDVETARMTPK